MTQKKPSIAQLLKAGVYFGHKTSKWHPSMSKYIFTERKGVHIINLKKTNECLEKALNFLHDLTQQNKVVLLVGTKKQIKGTVQKIAEQAGIPYVNNKWIGGTITNWNIVKKQILKLKKLKAEQEKGVWSKYTKKEALGLKKDLQHMQKLYGGIESLDKTPDALFVTDCKENKTAVKEAIVKKIPIVALADTNINISKIDYPIPANDDAIKSFTLILDSVKNVIIDAKKQNQNK